MSAAMPGGASSGEIVGLLLAAGKGRRFGSDKLMHPLADGLPMALVAAANLRPACDRVVVVLRAADHPLAGRLVDAGCEIVVCPEADGGMGHDPAVGARATADAAGWVVAPRVRQLRSQVLVSAISHFQKCHYNSANCSGAAGFPIPNA
ncbi:MAG: NTP transferase domain-containing protein [Gammaproteobacteria bacterium]